MWSSAAMTPRFNVLHLRDALLHILIVTSDYLSYSCLHISSKWSDDCPLKSAMLFLLVLLPCLIDVLPLTMHHSLQLSLQIPGPGTL